MTTRLKITAIKTAVETETIPMIDRRNGINTTPIGESIGTLVSGINKTIINTNIHIKTQIIAIRNGIEAMTSGITRVTTIETLVAKR